VLDDEIQPIVQLMNAAPGPPAHEIPVSQARAAHDRETEVMSGPGEQYFNLFDLHAAAEVRVVEQRGNWLWVELPDVRQGWIPITAVEKVTK